MVTCHGATVCALASPCMTNERSGGMLVVDRLMNGPVHTREYQFSLGSVTIDERINGWGMQSCLIELGPRI
jgi:hypothetical protein